jgi:hypothetical protein
VRKEQGREIRQGNLGDKTYEDPADLLVVVGSDDGLLDALSLQSVAVVGLTDRTELEFDVECFARLLGELEKASAASALLYLVPLKIVVKTVRGRTEAYALASSFPVPKIPTSLSFPPAERTDSMLATSSFLKVGYILMAVRVMPSEEDAVGVDMTSGEERDGCCAKRARKRNGWRL